MVPLEMIDTCYGNEKLIPDLSLRIDEIFEIFSFFSSEKGCQSTPCVLWLISSVRTKVNDRLSISAVTSFNYTHFTRDWFLLNFELIFHFFFHANSEPKRAFNSTTQIFHSNWVAYRILNYPKQIAEWETRRGKRAKEADLAPKAHKLTETFYVMRKEVLVPMFWIQNLSWN